MKEGESWIGRREGQLRQDVLPPWKPGDSVSLDAFDEYGYDEMREIIEHASSIYILKKIALLLVDEVERLEDIDYRW